MESKLKKERRIKLPNCWAARLGDLKAVSVKMMLIVKRDSEVLSVVVI